jgi:hypothetical protein
MTNSPSAHGRGKVLELWTSLGRRMSWRHPIPYSVLLLVLLFPSANLAVWDGIPLDRLAEFGALFCILPFLFWSDLRRTQADVLARLKIPGWILWGFLLLSLAAKGILLGSGESAGFAGCYRSPVVPVEHFHGPIPTGECERSYANPFFHLGVTRLDQTIDFGDEDWNLSFFNSGRFDFYDWEPGNYLRNRLPLWAHWTGQVTINPGEVIVIHYAGEGAVQIGSQFVQLPPAYEDGQTVTIPVRAGNQTFHARYEFNDGSRSGQSPSVWGPRAAFHVERRSPGGEEPLGAQPPAIGWSVLARLVDVPIGAILGFLTLSMMWFVLREAWWMVPLAAAAVVVRRFHFGPEGMQLAFAVVFALALLAVAWRRRPNWVGLYLVLFFVALLAARHQYPQWDYVALRTAGNDHLTFESLARSILETGSLQGGEAVFYSQPLFRYWKFAEHMLTGDGDVLYLALDMILLYGGIAFAFWRQGPSGRRWWYGAFWALVLAATVAIAGTFVEGWVRGGMSEYPTWILLFWAFPFLLRPTNVAEYGVGMCLLGVSLLTRTNQLTGVLYLAGVSFILVGRSFGWRGLVALAALLPIGLLPLAHNLWFGGVPVFATSSAGVNMALPPATWGRLFGGDKETLAILIRQIRYMLFLVEPTEGMIATTIAARSLLAIWIGTLLLIPLKRSKHLLVALLPMAYLAPYLVFYAHSHFPRHVLAGYLAMGLCTLHVASQRSNSGQQPESDSPP